MALDPVNDFSHRVMDVNPDRENGVATDRGNYVVLDPGNYKAEHFVN